MAAGALRFVHLLALVVWIGSVIFFSFVTAPALFGALPRDMAGRAMSNIFPRYYLLGTLCGGLSLLSAALLGLRAGSADRSLVVELVLLALMTALTVYAGQVILPRADALRLSLPGLEGTPAHEEAQRRFAALHARSVMLNGAVLLLGLGTLALLTFHPPEGWGR